MMIKRRLGPDPHANGKATGGARGCPDIWELEDGSIMVIGARKTKELKPFLSKSVTCGPDEEIVVIPRSTLLGAAKDI